MVFWKSLSWSYLFQSFFARAPFVSLTFQPEPQPLRVRGIHLKRLQSPLEPKEEADIREWLSKQFSSRPQLTMKDELLSSNDLALVLRDDNGGLIGFLRYHCIGRMLSAPPLQPEIYSVDCFCVDSQWRGKGLGDYLLTELQRYANEVRKPYAMFLKEGPSLPLLHRPHYTGEYAYRFTPSHEPISPHVYALTPTQVHKAIQLYRVMYPQTWMVWNAETLSEQKWLLYQRNSCYVWVCIQSAHQTMPDGKRMGWMTAWLESPELSEPFRAEACIALTNYAHHGFDAIWVDRKWTGQHMEWRRDGVFHFYTYQWSSNQSIGISYCITQ